VDWSLIAYALACVVVPITWGLIVVAISNRIDRHLVHGGQPGEDRRAPRPIEYHI
jgi:hypothetical protein